MCACGHTALCQKRQQVSWLLGFVGMIDTCLLSVSTTADAVISACFDRVDFAFLPAPVQSSLSQEGVHHCLHQISNAKVRLRHARS